MTFVGSWVRGFVGSWVRGFAVTLVCLTLGSCTSNIVSPQSSTSVPVQQTYDSSELLTMDEQYMKLNEALPTFSGIHVNEKDELVVDVLADAAIKNQQGLATQGLLDDNVTAEEARTAILNVLGTELLTELPEADSLDSLEQELRVQASSTQERPVVVMESGTYTFSQLMSWRIQIQELGLQYAVEFDTDEVDNVVYVGVEEEKDVEKLEKKIERLQIPQDALRISVAGAFYHLVGEVPDSSDESPLSATASSKYIYNWVRKIPGGVVTRFNGGKNACTIGFNVTRNGVKGFITAGHCTTNEGETNFDKYWQKFETVPEQFVATERVDPPYEPCNFLRLFRCRNTDSLFARYNSDKIAETETTLPDVGPASKDFDFTRRIPVSSAIVRTTPVGAVYSSMGLTTGFKNVKVEETCVNTGPTLFTSKFKYYCTTLARPTQGYGLPDQGDSGGPVYSLYRNSSGVAVVVRPVGIVSGINFGRLVFSNIADIEKDLGGRWRFSY